MSPKVPRKSEEQKRTKTLLFRVSPNEYEQFCLEAKKRHMQKGELFRYLTTRFLEAK
jgi:hypothetical protein